MKHLLTIAILVLPLATMAQSPLDTVVKPGTIEVILDDAAIGSLMDAYKQEGEKDQTIKGYRVQILVADNRTDINKVKGQFYNLFPDIKTFVIYQQPNFKLRVGNFRSRLEAHKALKEIAPHFPGAFITPDELKLSEF